MRSLLTALCTFFTVQTFAVTIDSIGVENNKGNQVIIHKVAAKETYYSIGRLYNVPPKDIISFNNNVNLNIGTEIKVPTQRPFSNASTKTSSPAVSVPATDIVEYKVGPKESLFSIARKFGTTVDNIKQLNGLTSNNLSIGQILKVRQEDSRANAIGSQAASGITSTPPVAEPQRANQSNAEATEPAEAAESISELPKPKARIGRLGVSERNEKGVAVSFDDESLDNTKMLALHRFAPVGTIIKVTNPMTARVTFVKVVGKFTENESTRDAIIVLTKATADQLGALDKRFLVNIDYGLPNE